MTGPHDHTCSLHLTVEDVAHYLRTDHTTITGWLDNGDLPGYRLPDRWLIMSDDLHRFLAGRHTGPADDTPSPRKDTLSP